MQPIAINGFANRYIEKNRHPRHENATGAFDPVVIPYKSKPSCKYFFKFTWLRMAVLWLSYRQKSPDFRALAYPFYPSLTLLP